MPEFSIIKIIEHQFHVENNKGESVIGYDTIIGHVPIVKLGLKDELKCQVLQWYGNTVPMKEPSDLPGKSDLNKPEMCKVIMQTAETASAREDTERLVKIFDSTYANAKLKQVDNNTTHLNSEERTQLLRLLEDYKYFFDGTLGDWVTYCVNLELKPGSKPFNSKNYLVPIVNKETFRKKLNAY